MRRFRVLFAICVVLAGLPLDLATPPGVHAAPQWTPGASLGWARQFHAAVTLTDGAVLVIGGGGRQGRDGPIADAIAAVERFDPAAGRWTAVAPLTAPRALHTATVLRDGTVLVVGGRGLGPDETARTAERYDPAINRWTAVAPLREGRIAHTATLLADGTVLVVGGGGYTGAGTTLAERYDPIADRWTATVPPLRERRQGQTATLLPDGTVLLLGGIPAPPDSCDPGAGCAVEAIADAERYDPVADRWSPVAPMPVAHADHTATSLRDGRILVVGGTTAALYDPAADHWAATRDLATATRHFNHTATRLDDGTVLVVGGFVGGAPKAQTVERFDPATGRWTISAPLTIGRAAQIAAPLPGGRLLVAGGVGPLASVEIFGDDGLPAVACFPQTGQCLRGRFLQHWRANGDLARNGYPISDERYERLEDGREYLVQYFERTRLEYHPENAPPYDVLLGQFGRRILGGAKPPVAPLAGQRHFPETGHNLGGLFRVYWEANGDLAQFGLPISEEFTETLEDGKLYTVQYFERARLEHHPENAGTPYVVLLGQFGRRILAQGGR